jgi:hypothetical protein
MNPNNLLYKYKPFDEYGKSILRDKNVYFALPEELNDQHDCRPSIKGTLDQMIGTEQNNNRKAALNLLKSFKANCSIPISLWQAAQTITEKAGVLSLTKNPVDPLLWAHYADGHKGFCIGFNVDYFPVEFDDSSDGLLYHDDVSYENTPPYKKMLLEEANKLQILLEKFDRNSDDFINTELPAFIESYQERMLSMTLGTKSKDWAYEREYRIVRRKHGALKFPPEAIKEIILGFHMSIQDEQVIRDLLSADEWTHVKFKQPKFSAHSFDFDIVDY